jgi:glycogen(starch) synthase
VRLLHLTTEFPPVIWGGLGTAVGGIVTASARAGITVGVLLVGGVLSADGSYSGWQPVPDKALPFGLGRIVKTSDGITFFHVAPHDGIDAGLRFARAWQPDVVHLHSSWLWPVASAIREECGTPIVFTVHSLDRAEYEWGGFVTHWEPQEAVIQAVDRIIAISESERQLLTQYCPTVSRRVRVIGNGIDDTSTARAAAQRRRSGPPQIMFSGRFVDRKGIHELLEAIPRVLTAEPDARFVLVGGYGTANDTERTWFAAPLLSFRGKIRFTGWLPPAEVMQCYAAADILVVPSWYEPFGMVILEGMLHGLAIAASDIGGPAEILRHETTGLLFPPRNADALVAALLRLVSDANLRQRLGGAAAAAVRRRWLWPRLIADMRSVYGEVANAN